MAREVTYEMAPSIWTRTGRGILLPPQPGQHPAQDFKRGCLAREHACLALGSGHKKTTAPCAAANGLEPSGLRVAPCRHHRPGLLIKNKSVLRNTGGRWPFLAAPLSLPVPGTGAWIGGFASYPFG